MIICKRDYLIRDLELLGDKGTYYYEDDFQIMRSPVGGYTVVCIRLHQVAHFSDAQKVVDFLSKYDKSLGKMCYQINIS